MKTAGGGWKVFAEKDDFLQGEHAAFLDPKPKELKAKQGATNYSCFKFDSRAIQPALGSGRRTLKQTIQSRRIIT